jgi:hypothetical protein
MAGLVPAIHAFACNRTDVDARNKSGHDDVAFGKAAAAIGFLILDFLRLRPCPELSARRPVMRMTKTRNNDKGDVP